MKRVIISDLHIGSKYANEKALIEFLSSISDDCDELILAGDIIDFIKIPSFTDHSYALFKIIENFKNKVIYIIGNHDKSFQNLINKEVFGVHFVDKYEFIEGKRKYRIEHGDKYEKGIIHHRFIISIISIVQDFIERWKNIDLTTWYHNLRLRKAKRIWDIIEWNKDADVFIMGHTHIPEVVIWVDKDEDIKTYVNTGDWVEHQSYVTIENDIIRLKNWQLEKEKRKALLNKAKE